MGNTKSTAVILSDKDIKLIRAMITYMLTEEDVDKVDYGFQDKLFNLDEKFEKISNKMERMAK
jgi:hypothetical protein